VISKLVSSAALAIVVLGTAIVSFAPTASASTYDLTGTASGDLVNLVFSVSDGAVTGVTGSIAGYGTVSNYSGSWPNVGDVLSSGLYVAPPSGPVTPGTVWTVQNPENSGGANFEVDNVWTNTAPYLTYAGGVAFLLSDNLTAYISAAYPSGSAGEYYLFLGNYNINTNFSAAVAQTPLPSTWTMLIAGLVGLGLFAFCAAKKSSVALSAA
jgi:hypothetical protein